MTGAGMDFQDELLSYLLGREMQHVDLYIKVEVELADDEKLDKVAREICRQVEKIYVVRKAELSSAVPKE
jgi:hypothetical protein